MLGCPRQLECRLLGRGKKENSEQLRLKERSEGSNDAQQIPEQLIYDMHFGAITNMIVHVNLLICTYILIGSYSVSTFLKAPSINN